LIVKSGSLYMMRRVRQRRKRAKGSRPRDGRGSFLAAEVPAVPKLLTVQCE
jgi:hypothetical protein